MDTAQFIFNEFCISCQVKLLWDVEHVLHRIAVGKEVDERKGKESCFFKLLAS